MPLPESFCSNDIINELKKRIEQVLNDELFFDIQIVFIGFDTNTKEEFVIVDRNACVCCAAEGLVTFVEANNLEHLSEPE